MSSLHLVDEELRPFLALIPVQQMNREALPQLRSGPAFPYPPAPEVPGVSVETRYVPGNGDQPDVRVLVYRSEQQTGPAPAILQIHGGGYVIGRPEMSDGANRLLTAALGAVIVSVDYRLAPEHPFPAPLEDCYAALTWMVAQAAELGIDPNRVAIKGESAGGGLAAGLALYARDRGEVSVAYQCLTYPMIDDREPAEPHPFTGEFIWTRDSNHFGWECFLGKEPGSADVSPYAAAARAEDLSGLPPTLIVTATLDLFLEENIEYARRLTRAGVPVELIVYPGGYHGFQMAPGAELGRRHERDVREALSRALNPGTRSGEAAAG